MKHMVRGFVCLAFAVGLALVARAAGEEPSIVRAKFRSVAQMEVPGYSESETLHDFPVLARLGPSTVPGFSYAACNPNTMRFYLADGTVLAHEVDTWNPEGTSLVWVRFPNLEIGAAAYLGWDPEEPSALPAVSSADVWSAYNLVWHLNEDLLDATGKGVALTPTNAPTAAIEDGVLGRHYVNSAANQGLLSPANIPTEVLPKANVFTVSAWFRSTYAAGAGRLISNKVGGDATDGFESAVWTAQNKVPQNKVFYRGKKTSGGDHYTPSTLVKNSWSYTACSFTGNTTALTWLNEGGSQSQNGCVAERNTGSPYVFGNNTASSVGNGHIGAYDELRISPVRSQAWLKTEHATVADALFCRFSATDNPFATLDARAYSRMSVVTVSNTSASVLLNFPILLRLSSERVSGFSPERIGEGGYELAFGSEDGVLLHYEVDTWNPAGESLVWVKLRVFRPGENTFRMYWRKKRQPTSVNQPALVWSKYAGVWHLNNPDADGATVDSTGLGLKARPTIGSAPTVVADNGFLGRGMRNGDKYQGIKVDPLPANVFPAAITVSVWCKPAASASAVQRLVSAQGIDAQQVNHPLTFEMQVGNNNLLYRPKYAIDAQGKVASTYDKSIAVSQKYTQGVWHRIMAQTVGGGEGRLRIDDTCLASYTASAWQQPTVADCRMGFATKGGEAETDGYSFQGEYDELRLSGPLSDEWVAQEYRTIADREFAVFSPAAKTPWDRGLMLILK